MKHEQVITERRAAVAGELLKPADLYTSVVKAYSTRCQISNVSTLFSGILGGALIGLAGLFYLVVMTDNSLSGGIAKLVGGFSFSLGLVMISITGAELFTGNILALLPRAYRMVSFAQIFHNWLAVYASNLLGCIAVALTAVSAGTLSGATATSLAEITASKLVQTPGSAFFEAVLCNLLVCLAIWTGLATRSPSGRALCIAGPITAFVAMGLEHSIANMFFFSAAVFMQLAPLSLHMLTMLGIVTLGNMVGALILCLLMGFAFRNSPEARSNLIPPVSPPPDLTP